MAATKDLWSELRLPFPAKDIEWRVQQSGVGKSGKPYIQVLAYVDNRAIMDRLDSVIGAGGWKNEYTSAPDGGILCGISIKHEGEWVTKYDGAENTQVEAVKGGLSGAMKRAAVQWGIGRYLYDLEATFVDLKDRGEHYIAIKDAKTKQTLKTGYWDTPKLPDWAVLKIDPKPGTKSTATTATVDDEATPDNKSINDTPGVVDDKSRTIKTDARKSPTKDDMDRLKAAFEEMGVTNSQAKVTFVKGVIGKPMPATTEDVQDVINAIKQRLAVLTDGETE